VRWQAFAARALLTPGASFDQRLLRFESTRLSS